MIMEIMIKIIIMMMDNNNFKVKVKEVIIKLMMKMIWMNMKL